MATSRDRILQRIRATSAPSTHPGPAPTSKFRATELWTDFERRLIELGGRMIGIDELNGLLTKRCFVEPAAARVLGVLPQIDDIWDAEVGISLAEFAIAETGTLVVTAGEGRARMSSLAPPINVIAVPRDAIVGTLADGLPKVPHATSVFITGPSRTADIEGILVRGVHGPGELLVYVYE